ncbi:hypothetical protein B0H65DRAFT_480037 [Neurospora tetraspora]|uniref:Uncharacterized protein n=1 Tax=Neurospora tetraspora TaxID=94610 RepID=A0AAE0MJV2_9PEZI|nr:hypothetical protein B0H65DRAFT_480037 [Neurospora tetraspora]
MVSNPPLILTLQGFITLRKPLFCLSLSILMPLSVSFELPRTGRDNRVTPYGTCPLKASRTLPLHPLPSTPYLLPPSSSLFL